MREGFAARRLIYVQPAWPELLAYWLGTPDASFVELWYVSFQNRQRGLAPVDAQPAAALVYVLLDRRLRQAQPNGDFLVSQEGGQPQTLFLTRAETLGHDPSGTATVALTFRTRRPDHLCFSKLGKMVPLR